MNEKEEILKKIKTENYVWIIYFILIGLCLYANTFEKNYVLYNDQKSKETYRKITIFIFTVALIIAGLIFIYIAIVDTELDVELAFN